MAGAAKCFEPGLIHGQETYVEVTVSTFEVRTAGDSFNEPPEGLEMAEGAPSTPG